MREVFAKTFEAAIREGGVKSVMNRASSNITVNRYVQAMRFLQIFFMMI